MRFLVLLFSLFVCLAGGAQAADTLKLAAAERAIAGVNVGFVSGNDLLAFAPNEQLTYVAAVHDSYIQVAKTWTTVRPCVTAEVTAGQAVDVVVKYLKEHPADRHLSAAYLSASAMSQAFPCRR